MCIDQWYTFLNYFIILLVLVVNMLLFLCRAHARLTITHSMQVHAPITVSVLLLWMVLVEYSSGKVHVWYTNLSPLSPPLYTIFCVH